MAEDLEQRLREAAEKATKGRWVHYRAPLRQGMSTINEVQCQSKAPIVQWSGFDNSLRSEKQHAANAAYIAAASPRNILALLEALSTERARSEGLDGPTHMHVKSGHLVRVIGDGWMQSGNWVGDFMQCDGEYERASVDMARVVVYEHGGKMWVRPKDEFEDGRFTALARQEEGKGNG